MKKYILSIFAALLLCWTAAAQTQDQMIFRAMEAELDRNMKELRMDDLGQPFWIGYIYSDIRAMQIAASLGEVTVSRCEPQRLNATRVLFGDYGMTSDINYTPYYNVRGSAFETDEGQIRREFWINTDANYKQTAPNMARKAAMRRQSARTPEEEALPDMLPVTSVSMVSESPEFGFDRREWEARAAELSAVFSNYPTLYASEVSVVAYDWTNYACTSEEVRMRLPVSFAAVNVKTTVRTPDGEEFSDRLEIYAQSDLTLPSTAELAGQITRFAANLAAYADAPKIEEFYSGPVLFTGQPVFSMFDGNLLSNNGNGLLVQRRPESSGNRGGGMMFYGGAPSSGSRRLENRIGQRVLDRRFTVVNHSALAEYEGTPLLGRYGIDADGVVPPDSCVVIDAGMLQTVLNGRIPTLKSPASTGSNRFSVNVSPTVAPGTIEIAAADGQPLAELEKQLITLARNDGLAYAYIVERMNDKFNLVWRVDTSTGERTPVRGAEIQPVSLTQLKRVAGVSDEREVRNYLAGQVPASMIYPSAILLEDIEIGELETAKDKPSPIVNPLLRE